MGIDLCCRTRELQQTVDKSVDMCIKDMSFRDLEGKLGINVTK
jgi:hypothetical protein